jgi:hypothetical protein
MLTLSVSLSKIEKTQFCRTDTPWVGRKLPAPVLKMIGVLIRCFSTVSYKYKTSQFNEKNSGGKGKKDC